MRPIEIGLLAVVALLLIAILALLRQGRAQAAAAQARTSEVDRLATLGAQTLNAPRAEDALIAVAEVIRSALVADWCAVFDAEREAPIAPVAISPAVAASRGALPVDGQLVQWVAEEGSEAAVLADGTTRVGAPDPVHVPAVAAVDVGVRALLLPLRVRDRTVGVVAIGAGHDLRIERAERRVLGALSHYAALGVERVRLVRDADHAGALREADRVKDALLASVSHDLRTPLTAIKALANEIARSGGGDDRAAMIEEEADRLNRFVGQLLDLSRAQAGGAGRAPEANEAEDLVGAALQQIAGRSDGREIRPTIRSPGDALLIGRFDFSDTLRALVNLLENALKYSAPDTVVELIVSRDGPWLSFAVADRGPGVAASERERIFDPFYRPPGALPDSGSTGLGLTIARRLAEAQHGTVTVEPRADGGDGSVFTLRVPALDLAELAAT